MLAESAQVHHDKMCICLRYQQELLAPCIKFSTTDLGSRQIKQATEANRPKHGLLAT